MAMTSTPGALAADAALDRLALAHSADVLNLAVEVADDAGLQGPLVRRHSRALLR